MSKNIISQDVREVFFKKRLPCHGPNCTSEVFRGLQLGESTLPCCHRVTHRNVVIRELRDMELERIHNEQD